MYLFLMIILIILVMFDMFYSWLDMNELFKKIDNFEQSIKALLENYFKGEEK